MKRWICALLLTVSALACGGDVIDALVVVQETNNACQMSCPPPCQGYRYSYERAVASGCAAGSVYVCSDEELCPSQIDDAVAPLVNCDQMHGYETQVPAECN